MTTRVLFMCPHAAGKSLLAATYFRAAAARSGLDVSIAVAGPDPDQQNMPDVVAALEAQGHRIAWQPRLISAADTAQADLLVSVGCDPRTIPTSRTLTEWQVPALSRDFAGCMQSIHDHAEALADRLAADQPDTPEHPSATHAPAGGV